MLPNHRGEHLLQKCVMTSTMGARIRLLRKKRGMTQVQLADLVGIAQGSLSLIENNESKDIAGATMAGLCRVLSTTPDFLVAGAGDPDSIDAAIEEHELVFTWRDLPPEGRKLVLESAAAIARAFGRQPKTTKTR